jgi:DNA-binding NarL/FixJ family response regulator
VGCSAISTALFPWTPRSRSNTSRWRAVFAVAWLDRQPAPAAKAKLTPRQNQLLQLLSGGASTEQIASELHLTTETVRNHIRHVLKGLGAHSRLEAVVLARRHGLIRGDHGK